MLVFKYGHKKGDVTDISTFCFALRFPSTSWLC